MIFASMIAVGLTFRHDMNSSVKGLTQTRVR